ncbi:MAG: family 10 glycosylhydrolase [Phycisphaerae bacterium]|nr:family 10 glycosylhydrolase [Phycisphaerae bacterium]
MVRESNAWRWCVLGGLSSLWLAATVASGQIIVDDADSACTTTGSWSSTSMPGQWGNSYLYKTTVAQQTGTVRWCPDLAVGGKYSVSVWYRSTGTSRPYDARYTVTHEGGSTEVSVNQQINGSQWVELGEYDFATGTSGSVTLSDESTDVNKSIVADAVMFEMVEGGRAEFRAFWADVFHYGLQDAAQIDQMVALAVQGKYNAIFAEVLAYHDNATGSNGAYWRSNIVTRSVYVTDAFDPLAYMVQQAHAHGLELHPWVVAYRASGLWPPPGNAYLGDRPHWLMVPRAAIGAGPAPVDGKYTFDPGNSEVQDYLISIAKEIVTYYAVDGMHWDYIRYTPTNADAGYPADDTVLTSGLARFQAITGRTDVPPAQGDADWDDFRRRTITELIRRCRAEIATITTNPNQPLRHSASVVTWGDAPEDFEDTSAYARFQNWREWLELGYLDTAVLMAYFREYNTDQAQWYRNWVDAAMGWRYDRQVVIGPGIYLNETFADSVTQMQYARNAEADGLSTYSYGATIDSDRNGVSEWDQAWYPYVRDNLFGGNVPTPSMPWRDRTIATEGTLYGQITDFDTGEPVDDADVQVEVGELASVKTDGNGYYVVTMIPSDAAGVMLDVRASKDEALAVHYRVKVVAGETRREDLALGEPICMPADLDCDGDVDMTDFGLFSQCFNGPNRVPACAP